MIIGLGFISKDTNNASEKQKTLFAITKYENKNFSINFIVRHLPRSLRRVVF